MSTQQLELHIDNSTGRKSYTDLYHEMVDRLSGMIVLSRIWRICPHHNNDGSMDVTALYDDGIEED